MRTLTVVAIVFTTVGVLSLAGAAANNWMGAEASDNVCDDPTVNRCAGRDARALNFKQSGEMLFWASLVVLTLATVLFVVNALWVAPRTIPATVRPTQEASNP